ncbi:hypothetical protein G6R40_01895 [Chryseobacterium sp. POL2]|uniref:hypothetical protein n=1 Tax=Chryseobacterium sp. POL2 TaxID=2713414 RepID=UPI0013E0EC47|nr:hypothetical protein [Chryseobacterium sp. POL2]QIG88484.1 hypothetical protein G6R40_01895 [Chryseobacterium sp. POL2]
MTKKIIPLILILSVQTFAQKVLFDTLKIDNTTKIIGRYPQFDKNKTYENYNFVIEDQSQIEKFTKNIKLGEEVPNSLENPNFKLTVIKNYKEIGSWTINPTQKSAMTHDGHTYKFDLNQISELNKTNPFDYEFKKVKFNSKENYKSFLLEQKKNPKYLFNYSPQFKYEGSFKMEFKKSSEFPHPKGISEYLDPLIEKITKKGEYSVSYVLDEKNMSNREQYTMTIQGTKELYEKLKVKGIKNQDWKVTEEEGTFFYKK